MRTRARLATPAPGAPHVELPGPEGDTATYLGDVLTSDARPDTHETLVARALHDVANAGVEWLA